MSVSGFIYPFKGFRFLISSPRLIALAAIPVAINTLLYAFFAWYVYSRFGRWVEALTANGDAWYWAVLHYILIVFVSLFLIVFIFYTFTMVGNLILAPFNEVISEKVEALYSEGTARDTAFSIGLLLKDMGRSYKAEAGRLILYLSGFLLLLLLNLIPLAGQALYAFSIILYTFFFLCWEFLDYSMERCKLSFGDKKKLAFSNPALFLSFGAGAALLLFIPFLNLTAIPVCVTGATLLFSDMKKQGKLSEISKNMGRQ